MARTLNKMVQYMDLKKVYPSSYGEIRNGIFAWFYELQPTSISQKHKIKITCKDLGKGVYEPIIYVKKPLPLQLAEGKSRLPHVYDHKKQRICLYEWKKVQWNCSMRISQTIVPWTAEWLYFYEVWVITGKWLGGGHGDDHPKEDEPQLNNNAERKR